RQAGGGGKPGKAAADKGKGDMVGLRIARGHRRIGIVEIMRELPRDAEILVVTIGAQPLVALLDILLAQPRLVDRGALRSLCLVSHRHPERLFRKLRGCLSIPPLRTDVRTDRASLQSTRTASAPCE